MKLQQNQVRVTHDDKSLTYTFDRYGRCEVVNQDGRTIGGGRAEFAELTIFADVTHRGYDIDDQSLETFMAQSPGLGQRLQLHVYKGGLQRNEQLLC